MAMGDTVNVVKKRPEDYHCDCKYCGKFLGELRPADGSYYNRLERRKYYDAIEKGPGGHIAKTPLHIARWAIQKYSAPGDWVLDPTIGAGTTAVEAITQGRSVAGMELEFGDVVEANIRKALEVNSRPDVKFARGDARNLRDFLKTNMKRKKFKLVVNNPPYFGDISMPSPKGNLRGKENRHLETRFDYDKELPNIAFLKEGQEYWDTIGQIYQTCADYLDSGGHFVIGVKDMVRNKQPFLLHKMLCEVLENVDGLQFVGTALLNHYPRTLFLNAYEKMHGTKPPFYQTISVFKKA